MEPIEKKPAARLKKSVNIVCWPHGYIRRKDTDSYLDQRIQLDQFTRTFSFPFYIIALLFFIGAVTAIGFKFFGPLFGLLFFFIPALVFGSIWPNVSRFFADRFLPSSLTNIQLTKEHIEFWWTVGGVTTVPAFVFWDDIADVYMKRSKGNSPYDDQLCFKKKSGKVFSIRLKQIASKEQWNKLLLALDSWCPIQPKNLERNIFDNIAPLDTGGPTFTTLWLQSLSTPPKRHRLEPLQVGTLLQEGRYTVEEQLGVGGQGRAYLAKKDTGGTVVIKEYLLPIYVDVKVRRQALKSIEQEASVLSALDHSNIVKLIEFFCEDHRAYLVLEHITGSSLKSLVNSSGPLEQTMVIEYAKKMCDILTYLHSRTPLVVHGDFTPENLIVQSDGTLKLIDFTIAQQADETITSIVAGKSAYMPPEQYRGSINPQTDIYALGATLYYLLTGEDPEPIASLHPILQREEVSSNLDAIVAKCTALDPKERYSSSAQVKEDLERLKSSSSG
jgi:tRNA A-37 threonylcarbamoyl transferase component Bud32